MLENPISIPQDVAENIPVEFPKPEMKDYTDISLGAGSKALLDSEINLTDSVSKFTSIAELKKDSDDIAIFLPGLVVSSQETFEPIVSLFRSHGYDTVGVDYSDSTYSRDLLKSQINDFIDDPIIKNKNVTLVGMSLGAGSVLDILANSRNEDVERIKDVVLLGTVYSDEDLKNGPFGKAFHLASKLTPELVAQRFAPLAKRLFRLDPEYSDRARHEVMSVSNEALIERIKSIGQTTPIERIGTFPGVNAIIGWWEDDFSSQQAREKIEALFPRRKEFIIPGHHAWTKTGATAINQAISF